MILTDKNTICLRIYFYLISFLPILSGLKLVAADLSQSLKGRHFGVAQANQQSFFFVCFFSASGFNA